jgi:hypothetical protein
MAADHGSPPPLNLRLALELAETMGFSFFFQNVTNVALLSM